MHAGVSSDHATFGEAHPAEHKPPAARGSSREGTGKNQEDQCESRRRRPDRGWSGRPGTGEETVLRSRRSAGARVQSGGGETTQGRAGAHDLRRVMPKIQWTNLPPALRDHLFDRLRERKITVEDPNPNNPRTEAAPSPRPSSSRGRGGHEPFPRPRRGRGQGEGELPM